MKVAIKKQRFEGIKANKQANNDEVFFLYKPDDKYDEENSLWSEL